MVGFLTLKYEKSTSKYIGKHIKKILNTVTETIHSGKPDTPDQSQHGNDPSTTKTQRQTLTQEEKKTNRDTIRIIMSERKNILPSFRNQDWRTVLSETENVNKLLTNIPSNDITELNDLIYEGEKIVCEKIGVPMKTRERKSKPGWEVRHESQIKRQRQQARILKRIIKKDSDGKSTAARTQKERLRRPTKNTCERRKTKKIPRQNQTN